MSEPRVHVVRGEVELGALPLSEVHALLATGLLRSTDEFWRPGQAAWRPLSELPAVEAPAGNLFSRARESLAGATTFLHKSAGTLASRVSSTLEGQQQHLGAAANRVLEDYLPTLQSAVDKAVAQSTRSLEAAARDDAFLGKLFGAVYDLLPRPVCRFVTEEAFIQFCFAHRERLLGTRAADQPATPDSSTSGPNQGA